MKRKCKQSSGNVFADLGIPNPEKALAKADIALKISDIIKKKEIPLKKNIIYLYCFYIAIKCKVITCK